MRIYFLLILLITFFVSCKKSSLDDALPDTPLLISPKINEICVASSSVNINKGLIEFKWKKADKAQTYELIVKNLITGEQKTYSSTDTVNKLELEKNTPFAWFVLAIGKNSKNKSQSNTNKFYSAGDGYIHYPPFQPELLKPKSDEVLSSSLTSTILKWRGSDVDGDIESYNVFFGTSTSQLPLLTNTKADSILVPVLPKSTYHWKIVCIDKRGNTSASDYFKFQTN
jgi:hypothetical protein